jgi:hypothetical protein
MTLHSTLRKTGIRVSSENCKSGGLGIFQYRKLFSVTYKLQAKRRPMKSQEVGFVVCKRRSVLNIGMYGGRYVDTREKQSEIEHMPGLREG